MQTKFFSKILSFKMNENNDTFTIIPNINKNEKTVNASTILSKSISSNDISYIKEALISRDFKNEILKLSYNQQKDLIVILVDLLDSDLRIEAIKIVYFILNQIGDSTGLCKNLIERSINFDKLIYLKGKIDYLKYKAKNIDKPLDPECEFYE